MGGERTPTEITAATEREGRTTTTTVSMSTSPLSSLGSPVPEPIPVQPDHFYGQSMSASPHSDKGYLDPDDDPLATRGIPVFKPDIAAFSDFEGFMNRIEPWGMRSGIVKIIPPPEWSAVLPSAVPQLSNVKLRNPIEQQMLGRGGLFRQQNMEKRRVMSVREWAELCAKDDLRAPTIQEAQGGRRYSVNVPSSRRRRARAPATLGEPQNESENGNENENENENENGDENDGKNENKNGNENGNRDVNENENDVCVYDDGAREQSVDGDGDTSMQDNDDTKPSTPSADPAASLPTPPHTTSPSDPTPPEEASTSTPAKRTAAERKEAKEALDTAFLASFEPHKHWLPQGMTAADYTPEFCRVLERLYWRNCSLGRAPWYGADMKGSLFTDETKHWNVAELPSVLTRLLGSDSKISGVNTPYLYFGMWRATFAWHVEDMDLFSINYIHFGSPKHWYAVPQGRAQALETTMKGYFPTDNTTCPQFLRHKSFLASPTLLSQSSVRPNVLVQHAGEFVVTFPRGYHAGFNLGFNCAESVNFALESWIELGLRAAFCACEADSVRIDVRGLIEAREREKNTGAQAQLAGPSPSRKRKVEVVTDGVEDIGKPKRPKVAKALPASPESNAPQQPQGRPAAKPKPRPKPPAADLDAGLAFPCCLCASTVMEGLLRVQDAPMSFSGVAKPNDGVWRAHEACARVIPETWVDEVSMDGGPEKEKVVWGVDGIVKDRWMLKCSACSRPRFKAHGAPIQCTKGKCSKAFHVSCAAGGAASGVAYRVLEEVEKEVVLVDEVQAALPVPAPTPTPAHAPVPKSLPPPMMATTTNAMDVDANQVPLLPSASAVPPIQAPISGVPPPTAPPTGPRVIKTIKKDLVEVLCSQHNPVIIAQKKANKDEKVRADLGALSEMSRIRIRNSSGVFEVSLVKVHTERGTVEVLWDGGQKREFRWGSIVWGSDGQMTGSKPTAEELAKRPPPALSILATTTTAPTIPPLRAPVAAPTHQQYNPYSQPTHAPYPYVFPTDQRQSQQAGPSRTPPTYQGMGQFRVQPQPLPATAQPWSQKSQQQYPSQTHQAPQWNPSTNTYTYASPYPGYYANPYYAQHAQTQPVGVPTPTPANLPTSSSSSSASSASTPAPAPATATATATVPASYSSTSHPQPFPRVTAAASPYNTAQAASYAGYYARTPYLPLAPRPGSGSGVGSSGGVQQTQPATSGIRASTGSGGAAASAQAHYAPAQRVAPAPVPSPATAAAPVSSSLPPQPQLPSAPSS
ncbi:hypothetical protein K439DRAFT_676101 [Ramaria rubella]|nr:hypothetical protein K439DRAFT_676101 [Ramaria rubella]